MKRCNACQVSYTGDMKRCPLCQSDLVGDAVPSVLPRQNPLIQPRRRAIQLLTFFTGFIVLLFVFFTFLFHWDWTIVGPSLISFFIDMWCVISAVKYNINIIKFLFRVPFVVYLCSAIWFLFTRNLYITTLIVPITVLSAFLFSVVMLICQRAKTIDYYFVYIMFNVAVGLLTLLFIPIGLAPWRLLIEICALVSLVLLFSLIVFSYRALRDTFFRQFSL